MIAPTQNVLEAATRPRKSCQDCRFWVADNHQPDHFCRGVFYCSANALSDPRGANAIRAMLVKGSVCTNWETRT